MSKRPFMLVCDYCPHDPGGSVRSLAQAKRLGWRDVKRARRNDPATGIYDEDVWWTHAGICPDCVLEESAGQMELDLGSPASRLPG